jgi:ribonuclease Z
VTELPVAQTPEAFLDIDGLGFESFEVNHFPVVPAFGYRANFDGRQVVLSGDTTFCESLAVASQGVDMLVCEALNVPMLGLLQAGLRGQGRNREADMLGDVPDYHIPVEDIAKLAAGAGIGELVLSHIIPPIPNNEERETAFMAGMSNVYTGPIRMARDMQRIPVTARTASK